MYRPSLDVSQLGQAFLRALAQLGVRTLSQLASHASPSKICPATLCAMGEKSERNTSPVENLLVEALNDAEVVKVENPSRSGPISNYYDL